MKKRSIILLLGGIGLVLLIVLGAITGGVLAQRFFQTRTALAFSHRLVPPEQEKGLLVAGVLPDSPAAEAGLARGDILLKVDSKEVNDLMDLKEIIEKKKTGDKVELGILHGDDQRNLTATLGEQEEAPFLGILSCGSGIVGRDFVYRFHPGRGSLPVSSEGATVVEVIPDSPADKAGLLEGDRILSVEGNKVTADESLSELISGYKPGESIGLEVIRKGDEEIEKITVTLGEHPEENGKAYLGIRYAPVPEIFIEGEHPPYDIPFPPSIRPGEEGRHFELPEGVSSGVLVGKVFEGSPADEAGLQRGDLITAIDGEGIEDLNPEDFAKTIQKHKPGDKITLTVYRKDGEEALEIQATLVEDPEQEGKVYLGIQAMGFIKIDGSDDPTREFHFEFKLPEWFHDENRPDNLAPFDEFESGVET